jgi:hypothetical protein
MIKMKELLLESDQDIDAQDIYNFYYLFTISQLHPQVLQSQYGAHIQQTYLDALKLKYVNTFRQIISKQIQKYHDRKRIDPDFDVKLMVGATGQTLWDLMKKTYRSDMNRRNEVWILACEFLTKLEASTDYKSICLYIDRLNNCIHNTSASILSKLVNGHSLVNAYNKVHHARSIGAYAKNVDKDLTQLNNQMDEVKAMDILPPHQPFGDRYEELQQALRQPFTALEFASRNGPNPQIEKVLKGTPYENEYRRVVAKYSK